MHMMGRYQWTVMHQEGAKQFAVLASSWPFHPDAASIIMA
jgi:homoserine acetyltransferase